MNLDFNKVWASDTSPEYPTDTQTKRGLSFLGTEAPTFDLHDAIFQRLDLKDQWLYDQIRIACERFGQGVDNSIAGAARDTMANAITNALLTQRKADEGGYGIVKMANADQTNAGREYNLAVSPKHLAEYVSVQNTWDNTRDKPQTATRWPYYSEVKDKPKLGTISSQDSSAVDISGGKATLERLNLSGGGSIFSDSSKGTIGIVNDAGDTLYLEPSNGLTYTSNDGVRHMRWEYGKLVVGEVPAERITGLGDMALQNGNKVNITGGSVIIDTSLGFNSGARIFHDTRTDAVGIKNAAGDALYIETDGKLTFGTSDGIVRNQWRWGEQVVGEIDKSHVKNLGSMADQDASSVAITGGTATLDRVTLPGGGYLFSNKDTGTIGIKNASGDTLYIEPNNGFTFTSNEGARRIRWEYGRLINGVIPVERIDGLGVAARKGVFDTNNWREIPWDGDKVVTASTARSLADQTALNIEDIESLKSSKIDIGRLSGLGLGRQGDSGYVSIPYDSGNGVQYMWIQWTWWAGNVSATATANGMFEGYADITWPRPFPNDCSFASPTINDVAGGGLMESVWLAGDSNTSYDANGARIQFATKANGGARMSGNIFAIGF